MNDNTKVFLGFLSGLFAGALAGILLAPDRGDATRRMIAERAKTFGTDFSDQLNPSIDKITELAKSAIDNVSEYANKVLKKAEDSANSASADVNK